MKGAPARRMRSVGEAVSLMFGDVSGAPPTRGGTANERWRRRGACAVKAASPREVRPEGVERAALSAPHPWRVKARLARSRDGGVAAPPSPPPQTRRRCWRRVAGRGWPGLASTRFQESDCSVGLKEEEATEKVMNEDIRIHAWPCSYYITSEKRWISGKLSLTSISVRFMADRSGELLVSFPLSSISEIKKESSNFIFSSLTILEKENTKHWFSSLQPNRNVVFNILEHFWREQLLSSEGTGAQAISPQTSKGKELTGLLAGSQKRLEDTAKVLEHQGEQFDNIMKGLNKIDSEMDVADRLLSELESPSWWPFGSKFSKGQLEAKPKETPATDVSGQKDGVIMCIPVIITERTGSNVKPGKLTLLASGLEISSSNSQLLHRFDKKEVDDVMVHTPYEISIRQRFIGKPDIGYRLLSAKMPGAIPILEMQFSKKIQFMEDAQGIIGARKTHQEDSGTSIWQAATGLIETMVHTRSAPSSSQETECSQQTQIQKQEQNISESETQELKRILQKLKSLSLETETELERQDEVLDAMTSSVDRATLNIDKQNRRMKKLT